MEKKYRVRVKAPEMKYGGQTENGFNLDLRNTYIGKGDGDNTFDGPGSINKSLTPVDRSEANIEAELGETALGDFDGDGMMEHMKIMGEKHTNGGTPLSVPEGTRIFSDTKKLKIKDESILKEFGKFSKSNLKKGVTPAELAKQYDINKYKAILDDPASDPIKKQTAQLMIENYNKKLDKLFSYQEAAKGYPQGVPDTVPNDFALGGVVPSFGPGGTKGKNYYNNNDTFDAWYQNQKQFYGDQAVDHYQPELNPDNVLAAQTMMAMNNPEVTIHAYRNGLLDLNNAAKKNGKMPKVGDLTDEEILAQHMDSYYVKDRAMLYKKDFPDSQSRNSFIQDNNLKQGPDKFMTDNKEGTPGYYDLVNNNFYQGYFPDKINSKEEEVPTTVNKQGVVTNNGPIPGTIDNVKREQGKRGQWWRQDKINTMSAALNLANLKKYLPWEPAASVQAPQFNFLSPERDLAANSEQAAIQAQMIGTFAGPQRARAVASAIQGQAATQAGNIISKYSNENIQLANQASQMLATVANQNIAMAAQRQKNMYDGNTRANARFDQERMMAQDVLRKQVVSGITNSQKTQWLCEMYPQYCVDNQGMMSFTKGKDIFAGKSQASPTGSPGTNYLATYQALKAQFPNASDEALRKAVDQQVGSGRSTDVNGDGIADMATSATQAQVMSMLAGMDR